MPIGSWESGLPFPGVVDVADFSPVADFSAATEENRETEKPRPKRLRPGTRRADPEGRDRLTAPHVQATTAW